MKDKQQSGLPDNPGSNPEGSKGTGSRDVPWTPGPWRLGLINYADIYSTITSELVALAIKCLPDESGHQTVANARLMAAAPELYSALEDVESMFTGFPLLAGANSGKLSRIQAVLAKARGEL